jgi:hypothetical protein
LEDSDSKIDKKKGKKEVEEEEEDDTPWSEFILSGL